MKKAVFFAAFLACALTASAAYLQVVEPVQARYDRASGQEIDLGMIGPGQAFDIVSLPDTGEISAQGKQSGKELYATWDKVEVVEATLPPGWKGEKALSYEKRIVSRVVVSRDTPEGYYTFMLKATDDYNGVEPLLVKVKILVSKNFLQIKVTNPQVSTGVWVPAVYEIHLKNDSSGSEAFDVWTEGLPKEWEARQRFFIPHNSAKTFRFEVVPEELGDYKFILVAQSVSSPETRAVEKVGIKAETTLSNDLKAISRGILVFPGIEQVAYSFAGIIGLFL